MRRGAEHGVAVVRVDQRPAPDIGEAPDRGRVVGTDRRPGDRRRHVRGRSGSRNLAARVRLLRGGGAYRARGEGQRKHRCDGGLHVRLPALTVDFNYRVVRRHVEGLVFDEPASATSR
jgi:hypothetical protein